MQNHIGDIQSIFSVGNLAKRLAARFEINEASALEMHQNYSARAKCIIACQGSGET